MAYKSYNPYSSDREPNRLRFLPFILLAAIALGMSLVGYDGYKRAHPKPKPVIPAGNGLTLSTNAVAVDPPFMLQCNDGGYVADLRECREYHQKLIYAINRTRKHKRKPETDHLRFTSSFRSPYDFEWRFITTVPMEITCSKLTGIMHGECVSRPLTPAEIEMYKPIAEKPAAPPMHSETFTIKGGDEGGSLNWVGPATAVEEYCSKLFGYEYLRCFESYKNGLDDSGPQRKPDCKMPADIDVCPTQQLAPTVHIPLCAQPAGCPAWYIDPKKSHD